MRWTQSNQAMEQHHVCLLAFICRDWTKKVSKLISPEMLVEVEADAVIGE